MHSVKSAATAQSLPPMPLGEVHPDPVGIGEQPASSSPHPERATANASATAIIDASRHAPGMVYCPNAQWSRKFKKVKQAA
mmetsp:Transcript_80526/g.126890  ORF Transcript_80526/g.126890 Transcript_80526/m.126890 type:complete len:81 (+) Transcript_80526:452-694(+)